jgi:hypothetical protein
MDESAERMPWTVPALGVGLLIPAYLQFDLQQWAGAAAWEAAFLSLMLAGLVFTGAVILIDGAWGRERRLAHWIVWPAAVVLVASFAGPALQAAAATWAQLPLRAVVGGAFPPAALIACVAMWVMRRERRRRGDSDDSVT